MVRLLHYSDLENAYDDPEHIGRIAGLLRALDDEDALVLGTGDDTSPGVLALTTEAGQSLPFFRAVDPDFETFGNHDFDYGPDRALEIVAESPQTWLTANVYRDGSRFGADAGTKPWSIVDRDGTTVGVFGLTDPATPSINPNADGLEFADPVPAAEDAIAALRERGADLVVALSHLGADDDRLAVETDVDVILGGHVHSERIERIDGTLLTRPGVNGDVVLEIRPDADPEVRRHETADAPREPAVADAMTELETDLGLDEVVATVETPIERTAAAAFRGESRIGNFVADAYRWATGADVGLQNSGGIREGDPLAGEVTVGDLVSVIPFEEPVAVARLSGDQLRDVLAEGSGANVEFGEPEWWHAHVSGVSLTLDRDAHDLVSARIDGQRIDPDATYTLATSEYLFHTDHEFPSLTDDDRIETGDLQYEVLADYARRTGIDPAIEGRIERQ